jgi:4-alpha-glucanotransferase
MEKNSKAAGRGAGILLHISSLPSAYGIGDLGPEAYRFADFLAQAGQKYWQLLPLNPVEDAQSYSPYSSSSSMAGNVLFISPELLAKDGLLKIDKRSPVTNSKKVNYPQTIKLKEQLLDEAFRTFMKSQTNRSNYQQFTDDNRTWLDDFALFTALRNQYNKPWFKWPLDIRHRKKQALIKTVAAHREEIEKTKWLQFIFFEQWRLFRSYCKDNGIQLVGDLPFYVSYDSADVWSHQKYFSITSDGKLNGVAGVPPDYFNGNGQLWGMPVFRWEVLKKDNYRWWIKRLQKNAELFDIIRLDHFRAFADYWVVPAGHKTARRGKWKYGPAYDFFNVIKNHFPHLPFIAEDLGDINEKVVRLRKDYALPGMKILQFAFGNNISESEYIPHNYGENFFVYTGTHDNNTTRGWFRKDIGKTERNNLSRYAGVRVTGKNVCEIMIRLAYGSVARVAIIPMQDILGLDERSRMNVPSTTQDNWAWRMDSNHYLKSVRYLKDLTELYAR